MIYDISSELNKKRVFHKVDNPFIITKRTATKIPLINNDVAYITGVIAGDGTMVTSKRKKGGYYYELRIYSGSLIYLKYLRYLTNKLFGYIGKITKDKRKNKTYILSIRSAAIFHYFKLLDAKFSSNNMPHFTKTNPYHLTEYISGLIDTDGSVSRRRIQLKLKNKIFINNVYFRLLEIGANPNAPKVNYTCLVPFYYLRFDNIFPLRLK